MSKENILEALKKVREGEKRNFKQSIDLIINMKSLDMNKPESKLKLEIAMPNGIGKKIKIGIFADLLIPQIKNLNDDNVILIRKDEIEDLAKNKRSAKKLATVCKAFLAEAPLMPSVGKNLGPFLAVRNKMPKPIPPNTPNIKPLIERNYGVVNIATKTVPKTSCTVGTEEMDDEKLATNIEAVINAVMAALPKGKENIRNYIVKTTMGKPVKIVM